MNAHSVIMPHPDRSWPRAIVWHGGRTFNVHVLNAGGVLLGPVPRTAFTWSPDDQRPPTLAEAVEHMDKVIGDSDHTAWDPWRKVNTGF